ncbi:MAG: hypothetical protein KA297_30940 [Kofleriaceae bacterium]|nr:hypothetical protein [Kofleriaceae bacterium]
MNPAHASRLGMLAATLSAAAMALSACSSATPSDGADARRAADATPISDAGGGEVDAPVDAPRLPDAMVQPPDASVDARPPDASVDATVVPPDASVDASTCPTSPCDLQAQCGCPGGQACDIDFTDLVGNACRAVTTPGDENDTCASQSACAAGWVCVGDAAGTSCEEYCDADTDCGAPRGRCVVQLVDGSAQPIPGAVTCSSGCDPTGVVTGGVCPAAWKCSLAGATFLGSAVDIVDCTPAGAGTVGAGCTGDNQCAAGTLCIDNDGGGPNPTACNRICQLPGGGQCGVGQACVGFAPAFLVNGFEYGICR